MDFVKMLMDQLLTNPMFQGACLSVCINKLKETFKSLDTSEKDPRTVKRVQILVMGLSLLCTLLTAWSTNHLASVDTTTLMNFITIIISALGTHKLGKDIKDLRK